MTKSGDFARTTNFRRQN